MRRCSPSRCLAFDIDIVFDRDWNTQQREPLTGIEAMLGLHRFGNSAFVTHDAISVQVAVETRDPIEIQPDKLGRRDRT